MTHWIPKKIATIIISEMEKKYPIDYLTQDPLLQMWILGLIIVGGCFIGVWYDNTYGYSSNEVR